MEALINTGVEEREEWRARILRALADLRAENVAAKANGSKLEDAGDDARRGDARI